MNSKILQTLKESAAIPSMPQVVTRFLEIIQDPNFSYDDVVKILSSDAGTVSEILRLANSSLFGLSRKVTALKQALALLGPKRTRSVVLGRYLVEGMSKTRAGQLNTSYFWRRSLASAVLSSRIAGAVEPGLKDDAFISALLADIGIAILSEAFEETYAPIVAKYAPNGEFFTEDQERECVEVTHAEVSAMVLAHWGLPETICTAVNLQQSDTVQPNDDSGKIARILNASDRIAKILCEIPSEEEIALHCGEAAAFVELDIAKLAHIIGEIESDVEELSSILRTDVIPSNVYTLIAKTIQEKLMTPAT